MNFLAHKIELRPTPKQVRFFNNACGARRHCYNQLLAHFNQPGMKWSLKDARDKYNVLRNEFGFYTEVSRVNTENAIGDLEKAFKTFFRICREKKSATAAGNQLKKKKKKPRKDGKPEGYPRFKRKDDSDSFSIRHSVKFKTDARWLKIEKLPSWIKMREPVRFSGIQKQVTISKDATGKFFASILVETPDVQKPCGDGVVGIDLGIKSLAVLSDGKVFSASRKYKNALKTLKKRQRIMSRRKKESKRRARAKLKVAKTHARIARQRKAIVHHVSDYVTRNFHTIHLEDLNVKGMVRNRKLAQAISDVGFYMIRSSIEYKAKLRGVKVVIVDRFFPSSKTCSACGSVKKDLSLRDRVYICDSCGMVMDRDLNAALNLKFFGEDRIRPTDQKTDVEPDKTGCLAICNQTAMKRQQLTIW